MFGLTKTLHRKSVGWSDQTKLILRGPNVNSYEQS